MARTVLLVLLARATADIGDPGYSDASTLEESNRLTTRRAFSGEGGRYRFALDTANKEAAAAKAAAI